MDPIIGNGIDPGLLRIVDKRGQKGEGEWRRKRPPASAPSDEGVKDQDEEADPDSPKHEIDDLA